MRPDPIDRLGARLFEIARNESAPVGAERRAFEAAQREISRQKPANARLSTGRRWAFAGACVALAAACALLLRPRETSIGIRAEPTTVAQREPVRGIVPHLEASSRDVPAVPPPTVAPKLAPRAAPAAVHSAAASLSDELDALKVASSALSGGDTQAALAALDRYDRVLKGQKMRAEATLLRIEALSRAGQAPAASALAQRFVDQNPGSPLVDRARSFVRE